jgi:hypothetical protein
MSKVDSSLSWNDTMPFGKKHKGKTIQEIFQQEPSYLLWLRDQRKKDNGDIKFFARDVLIKLDEFLKTSKSLSRQYSSWHVALEQPEPVKVVITPELEDAYGDMWGAF